MTFDRRAVLAALGSAIAAGLAPSGALGRGSPRRVLSAIGRAGGSFGLAGFDGTGELWLDLPLPGRGHGIAVDPTGRWAVALARRPGRFALAVALESGATTAFESAIERHFYGHGVFSPDGALLYTTENDYEGGVGVVGVRDARDGFRRVGELPAHAIGPHDIALLSDGRTLVVANGGIRTHPASGRRKLNLDSMAPSVAYLDRENGRLLEEVRLDPSLHRLSLRHLAVAPDDEVVVAGQLQGARDAALPLIALHRPGSRPRLLSLPEAAARRSRSYCGHVALDGAGATIAVSHPRGGLVTLWSRKEERLLHSVELPDACGLCPSAGAGRFLISSGAGELLLHDAALGTSSRLGDDLGVQWDNHLSALSW